MTSCKSAISLVSNLWEEYKDIASKLGCTIAGGIGGPEAAIKCLETSNKVEEAIKKASQTYQDVVGRTSSLTIGPRKLRPNIWEEGNIFGTFERLFVTAVPMNKDTVSITIKELGGQGKVGIAICAVDEKGKDNKLAEYTLNEHKKGKQNKGQQIKKTLKNVKGKWIVVHFDGKSVTNTFQYKLFLDA